MGTIFTPINQLRLTNVSIVRLKKGGKRFEIACYKNKVLEWRNKVETDLDNVLQTQQVFLNVSKGQVAGKEELKKAFKTDNVNDIILEILSKGELQVGEKERAAQIQNISKDIATIIADKCVNPETNRPYAVSIIEKAMSEIHYSIHPSKNAKQQALDVIQMLQKSQTLKIARAQMRIRLFLPNKDAKRMKEKLREYLGDIETEDWDDDYEAISLIDPGHFRILMNMIQDETKGKGKLEVMDIKENLE